MERKYSERTGDQQQHDKKKEDQFAPVVFIGQMSSEQSDGNGRQRFGKANQTQRHGIFGVRINHPAKNDRLHLPADGKQQSRCNEKPVIPDFQGIISLAVKEFFDRKKISYDAFCLAKCW